MMRFLFLTACLVLATDAYAPRCPDSPVSTPIRFMTGNDNKETSTSWNLFKEAADMINNFDAMVDDFFYKRMGNGEVFYGKRKYKPSGRVEGKYNGMGLTDKLKIDVSRERKELFLQEKRRREDEGQQ